MGGGGGSSGEIKYPEHMTTIHTDWLGQMNTIIAGMTNPYEGLTWEDPAGYFGELPDPAVVLAKLIDIDLATDIIPAIEAAYKAIRGDAAWDPDWVIDWDGTYVPTIPVDEIADAVEAVGLKIRDTVLRDIGRFEAEAVHAGAVMSSTFLLARNTMLDNVANGQMEVEKSLIAQGALTKMQQEMTMEEMRFKKAIADVERTKFVWQQALQTLAHGITQTAQSSHYAIDAMRIMWAAQMEVDKVSVEYAGKASKFALAKFEYPGQLLGSISGIASVIDQEGSAVGNALGGALSGASMGAAAGPWGAAAGGVIGGLSGLLG